MIIFSIGVYLVGLFASFTLPGSIIANLFVSVGLSSLFYVFWTRIVKEKLSILVKPLIWIGVSSFGVYLLHQVFLIWTRPFFGGATRLVVAVLLLLLSFPIARLIELAVARLLTFLSELKINRVLVLGSLVVSIGMMGIWKVISPGLLGQLPYEIMLGLLALGILFLIIIEGKVPAPSRPIWRLIILTGSDHFDPEFIFSSA